MMMQCKFFAVPLPLPLPLYESRHDQETCHLATALL